MFYSACMIMDADWDMAIERNRKPLVRIVATLFAAIGLAEGKLVERLAWPLYRAVLSILIPAESAVRRLIVVAARNLVIKPPPSRPASKEKAPQRSSTGKRKGNGKGRISFRLFDRRKRYGWVYGPTLDGVTPDPDVQGVAEASPMRPPFRPPPPAPRAPDGKVNAARLCRRLLAIKAALDDLPGQAKRYARWRAKPIEQRRPQYPSALRLGSAPGSRKKATHEVDNILTECHYLAWSLPKPKPDTS